MRTLKTLLSHDVDGALYLMSQLNTRLNPSDGLIVDNSDEELLQRSSEIIEDFLFWLNLKTEEAKGS